NIPRVLVIPINPRCFSPQWDLNPAFAFLQEFDVIDSWFKDPTRAIQPIDDVEETPGFFDAYDQTVVRYELSRLSTIGQFRALIASNANEPAERHERAKQLLIFHYTHELIPAHRKLGSLVETVELARRMGINPIVYFTPI